ncbi:lytic transglycosylase domain-containing protein [bacterium]|nr:lytic transglycosylase domain-containing protein [bacterium]
MIRVKLLIPLIISLNLLILPAFADTVSKVTVKELIVKHAKEMGIEPALALSIAKTESGFNHSTKSRYGAVGVFQLMPRTANKMGFNPYKVSDNIKGGITYYKMMYKMFGSVELALAAYNAGPGNVKKYNGMPPFSETKKFVAKIMQDYNNFKVNPDPSMVAKQETEVSNTETAEVQEAQETEETLAMIEEKQKQEELAKQEEFRREQRTVINSFLAEQAI